ncbi:MAG: HDOD domain-containing protein, partial [Anaerolineaceae bacterium]|nr:HDOD domain-containing protein [Anaerolineaceae bacterium]
LLVGRQPIFNRTMQVYAYELLYRSGDGNRADFSDADKATTQVVLNALIEMGLESIVGDAIVFINLTRNFLVGNFPILLPANRVVIEILETVESDPQLLEAVSALRNKGFTLALDDVVSLDRISPFAGIANIIKLDLMQIDRVDLPDIVAGVKSSGFKVLAEKVETQADYNLCRRLGVDYYQGYFLCRPNVVRSQKMDSSRLVIMQSIAMLQNQKTNFTDLETIIARDVGLSYKLLRLSNSGYYSFTTEVKSLRQAISLIGLDTLRGWMSLILMSSLVDKPPELTNIALQRAHMSESIAKIYGQPQPEIFFLVGLFSVLDALMDQPMADIIPELNLSPTISGALLKYEGLPGFILKAIKAYEMGDWATVKTLNIPDETLTSIYLDSIKWTDILAKEIRSSTMAAE